MSAIHIRGFSGCSVDVRRLEAADIDWYRNGPKGQTTTNVDAAAVIGGRQTAETRGDETAAGRREGQGQRSLSGAAPQLSDCQPGMQIVVKTSFDDPGCGAASSVRLLRQGAKQLEFCAWNPLPGRVVAPAILCSRLETVLTSYLAKPSALGSAGGGDVAAPVAAAAAASVSSGLGPSQQRAVLVMPFVPHSDALTFLTHANVDRVQVFVRTIIDVLQAYLTVSPVSRIDLSVWRNKVADVRNVCRRNPVICPPHRGDPKEAAPPPPTPLWACVERSCGLLDTWVNTCEQRGEGLSLPLGRCHGDLTLSNLLMRENRGGPQNLSADVGDAGAAAGSFTVVLIDFLDAFLESPLLDMAKLNQDLRFGWTLRMMSGEDRARVDKVRLFLVFEAAAKSIRQTFGHFDWYRRAFRPATVLNQLRVLQYAKDADIANYLAFTVDAELESWRHEGGCA